MLLQCYTKRMRLKEQPESLLMLGRTILFLVFCFKYSILIVCILDDFRDKKISLMHRSNQLNVRTKTE